MNRNQVIGALSSVFLIPSFVLTVIPTAAHADVGQAVCIAFGVVLLPVIPFAIRRARQTHVRIFLVTLGAGLLAYNFGNCLDALNRGHAAAVDVSAKLTELNARRNAIPAHAVASSDRLAAAQAARDGECRTGYGPKCRDREDALAIAQRDHDATERAALVEADLDRATAAQTALVPLEATARETASQIASLSGIQPESVAKHRPIFKALIVEALGGFAPWLMVLVFGEAAPRPLPKPKPKPKAVVAASEDSVSQWHRARIESRQGAKLRAGKAFDDYGKWCAANGLTAVGIHAFGRTMKNELGVQKIDKNNRTSYCDIALRPLRPQGRNPRGDVGGDGREDPARTLH